MKKISSLLSILCSMSICFKILLKYLQKFFRFFSITRYKSCQFILVIVPVSSFIHWMSQVRLTRLKIIFVILFFLVVYNEWISLYLKVSSWEKFSDQNEETIKLLLVADPQILSIKSEPNFPFSYIAVWDGNRFVSRGFHQAVQFAKPDVIVFLGDLINDGSVSSDEEFVIQSQKFKSLFPISSSKVFYIPGDNDIGGEGFDRVSPQKIQRFVSEFHSSNPTVEKFLLLYHVSAIPEAKFSTTANSSVSDAYPVIFSHFPLTAGARKSIINQIKVIHPSLIFSAHDHDSYEFVATKDNPKAQHFMMLREEGKVLNIDLKKDDLHEISVPTCSYRMGKRRFGFGFGQITKSGNFKYTVLWLPNRFYQLWLYLWGLCICISMLIYPVVLHLSGKFKAKGDSKASLFTKYHRV